MIPKYLISTWEDVVKITLQSEDLTYSDLTHFRKINMKMTTFILYCKYLIKLIKCLKKSEINKFISLGKTYNTLILLLEM